MPRVQFKTITQQAFELDIDESATVEQVKQQIAEAKGKDSFPVDVQKLIFNGKVLEDGQTLPEVAQGKFIVVMVVKKAAPKPPPNSSGAAQQGTSDDKDEKKDAKKEADSAESADKKSTPPAPDTNQIYSPEQNRTIEDIVTMGYPREEVVRACQAAFFNADRAVEYLCTGIPEGLNLNPVPVGAGDGDDEDDDGEGEGGIEMPANLNFLANSPQFQQLREMVRADPAALPQILQQIAQQNPELMELIRNQQDQFLQLLNLNAEPQGQILGGQIVEGGQPFGGQGGGVGGNVPGAGMPGQRIAIPITQEDRAAIDRLIGMGFPEPLVIEAYLACDKNEDLAVNYILQRMEEQ